jgi:hypothetical protein
MKLNEDDDFGFTFADSTEIQAKVTTTEDKLQGRDKFVARVREDLDLQDKIKAMVNGEV